MRKRKLIWVLLVISVLYYIFLFVFQTEISKHILLYPEDYQINEHCIVIRFQRTTGPSFYVAEGSDYLKKEVSAPPRDLNVSEVEITGTSVFDHFFFNYPDYFPPEWLVYGKVVGITDQYQICYSGTIPIFECERLYPKATLSEPLNDGIIFFKFPLGLILTTIIFLWPVVIIMIVYCRK